MKRKILFFLFVFLISTHSTAQSNISFVDLEFILDESKAGKQINKLLTEKRKKETDKLKKIQKKLKDDEQSIKNKSNILSKEEINKSVEKLKTEVISYNNLKNKKEKEFNLKKTEYINKLLVEINKILIVYAKKNSIDIVIKKENLITGKKELDITQFILVELDKKKINF